MHSSTRQSLPVYEEKPKYGPKKDNTSLAKPLVIILASVIIVWVMLSFDDLGSDPDAMHPLNQRGLPAPGIAQELIDRDTQILNDILEKQLTPAEQAEKDLGYEHNAFNQFISDRLSLHRAIPEARQPECFDERYYPAANLPTTSVIIIFHNEAVSTLLRTVWSVLDRSPPSLIKEILLVDDASPGEWLKDLDAKVATIPKTRVIHLPKRSGLIRAKVEGANQAKGDVLTFLDSHCECNPGWLEPLLDRIKRSRVTVAMPAIDVIDQHTFEYYGGGAAEQRGIPTWSLQFSWLEITPYTRKTRKSPVEPFESPAMAGGLFSIDRKYFFEIGTYDMGMDVWGGENLEMSFRIWMCGGRLEVVPCSRVGHVFRDRSPYKFEKDVGETVASNLNRVAEVWMDQYAEIYYGLTNNRGVKYGNITDRVKLRKDLKCHPFKWYLENVFSDWFVPMRENILAKGSVRNSVTGRCLNTKTDEVDDMDEAALVPCEAGRTDTNEEFFLSKDPKNTLRVEVLFGSRCLNPQSHEEGARVVLSRCFVDGGDLQWDYLLTRQLKHTKSGLCLEAHTDSGRKEETVAVLRTCKRSNPRQKWFFSEYSPHGEKEQNLPNTEQ